MESSKENGIASPVATLVSEHRSEYGFALILGILLVLNVTGIFRTVFGLNTAILVTFLAGYKTFYNTVSALFERTVSADMALCIAVIAAISVGEYLAAAEAMFIVMVGETLESFAAGRTEAAIERFVSQMPRIARVLRKGIEEEVDAATLAPGDRILVRAGERIPGDGIIEHGASGINESFVTGEPLPKYKQAGDEVFSGTVNEDALLRIRISRAGGETTLARVIDLVREAKGKRAPVERLADRYAKFFLPALLLAGALTFYFTGNWVRTVAVLIVACPCALILATPTAMVAAIGGLARRGILVRGGDVLQRAAKVDTAVFDKTGTVTEGCFEITEIIALHRTHDEILALAAAAESGSNHALARVIVQEARSRTLRVPQAQDARVIPGRGVECNIGGRSVRAGSAAYLAESGIVDTQALEDEADRAGATAVLVSEDDELAGAILLRDRVREGALEAARELRNLAIGNQIMLTGDRRRAAESIARDIGIHNVEADLLPDQKLDRIRQLSAQGFTIAMLGDGINDAAALAGAHVGIAMKGASDITAEVAGVVYLPHSLDRLPQLFDISRRAVRTAWLNIVLFAGAVNLVAVLACATGRLGPIGAAFTHQLASFCVMMNSLRLLRLGGRSPSHWRDRISDLIRTSRLPAYLDLLRRIDPDAAFAWMIAHRRQFAKPAVVGGSALILLNGFYTVKPDELGIVERFGKIVVPFSPPGLHYKLPWPVDRLTRIQAHRVRAVEIGFRSNPSTPNAEPSSYEWNAQHRSGRFERRPEESLSLTGDQNMIELNATVHYEVEHPDAFLFRQVDGEATIRASAESVIHGITAATSLDAVLTTGRRSMEARAEAELQRRMDKYDAGVHVLRVKLQDVHPSTDVVDAFREVSAAFEEKSRLVNEALGYRNERVALARGTAKAQVHNAEAYTLARINRASGEASRFEQQESAFRSAPGPTETRLYLESVEQVLPGKKKFIVDSGKGRRHLLLLEDGVELAPPGAAIVLPQSPKPAIRE